MKLPVLLDDVMRLPTDVAVIDRCNARLALTEVHPTATEKRFQERLGGLFDTRNRG